MKLRNKLLTALVPAAVVVTATPMVLTNCGPSATEYITYSGDKTHTSTSNTWELTFTLANALETNQTLKVGYASAHNMGWIYDPEVSGTTVTVTVERGSGATVSDPATFDLNFSCYTEPSTVVTTWEQKITGFTFKVSA